MSPLLIADIAVGSICIAVGLLHLAVFVRRRDLKPHLFFALMAIGAGLSVLTDPWMITAETVPSFVSALKFRITFEGILWVALIWFIDAYTQTARRSLVWVLTVAYTLAVLLNLFLPFSILFSQISHLHSVTLTWGENIVSANGALNPWRFLPDAAFVFLLFLAGESCYRLYRHAHQRRALGLGISLFLILGVGYVDGILMDLGIVDPPSLIGITFLALVLVMSGQLTGEVVRASALSRKIALERERMDVILSALNTGLALMNEELDVIWVNKGTRKALPWDDPVGKKCYAFAENLKEPCEGCGGLQAIADGEIHETERINSTNNRWYHIVSVPIKDHKGQVTHVLESSTDISDRKRTEEARDQAMRELETLKVRLEEENIYLKSEIEEDLGFSKIIGKSNALLYVLGRIKQVAETDAIVLVQGETGTGKELVSRAIHQTSLRSGKPFVKVNCAALPANLVESELFGHEKGAFTGATQMRKGRFEVADKGTLFLDEISELSAGTQAKLLRVVQEGQFERVGSSRTITVDVRIIAATNRDLEKDVAAGRFRADLFYRLNVYPITVPPLRVRREDIPLLVEFFVPRIASHLGKHVDQIPTHVMEVLGKQEWLGNVRELRNALERAVINTPDRVLSLPEGFRSPAEVTGLPHPEKGLESLDEMTRRYIVEVLEKCKWQIEGSGRASEILKLKPSTLRSRMQRLGIRRRKKG